MVLNQEISINYVIQDNKSVSVNSVLLVYLNLLKEKKKIMWPEGSTLIQNEFVVPVYTKQIPRLLLVNSLKHTRISNFTGVIHF